MKNQLILLIAIFIFTLGCANSQKKSRSLTSYTTAQDQYWNDLTMESIEAKTSILNVLQENNPALYAQILKDSKDPYLPMQWGQSLNFDSGAKKIIVEEKIIADLQQLFNIKNDNKIVHAGIIHTYGYLFSTIDTPFGFKRKRWIDPAVNKGFELTGNSLSPETIDGGMLSNVTYFAGMLAFKNKSDLSLLKNVSNEVFTYNYSQLKYDRLEEVLKDYTIVTTFVPFLNSVNDYLLIYSVVSHLDKKEQLITVFPVNAESYKKAVAQENLGTDQKISLRYNAYLPGLSAELKGIRKVTKHNL